MTDQEVHQHLDPDVPPFHRLDWPRVTGVRSWHAVDQVEDPLVVQDAEHVPGQHLRCEVAPLVWLEAGAHRSHLAFVHAVVCHPDRPSPSTKESAHKTYPQPA